MLDLRIDAARQTIGAVTKAREVVPPKCSCGGRPSILTLCRIPPGRPHLMIGTARADAAVGRARCDYGRTHPRVSRDGIDPPTAAL